MLLNSLLQGCEKRERTTKMWRIIKQKVMAGISDLREEKNGLNQNIRKRDNGRNKDQKDKISWNPYRMHLFYIEDAACAVLKPTEFLLTVNRPLDKI